MLIGLFTSLGLTERVARILSPIAIGLVILIAFYLALNAYGDARYDAGRDAADKAWAAAADKLEAESKAAASKADTAAQERESAYAERLAKEKEKIDATIADGGDPFDVLFPAGGVRDDARGGASPP